MDLRAFALIVSAHLYYVRNSHAMDLRTFKLIGSAHLYCVRKFICHVMHLARALSIKMNNDRTDAWPLL